MKRISSSVLTKIEIKLVGGITVDKWMNFLNVSCWNLFNKQL